MWIVYKCNEFFSILNKYIRKSNVLMYILNIAHIKENKMDRDTNTPHTQTHMYAYM